MVSNWTGDCPANIKPPGPTQPSIPPGSVNEYRRMLGSKRQVLRCTGLISRTMELPAQGPVNGRWAPGYALLVEHAELYFYLVIVSTVTACVCDCRNVLRRHLTRWLAVVIRPCGVSSTSFHVRTRHPEGAAVAQPDWRSFHFTRGTLYSQHFE